MPDLGREKHDCLARRVAAANQRNVFAGTQPRLNGGRPIEYSGTFKCPQIGDVEPAITRAGGNDDRPRPNAALAGEIKPERVSSAVEPLHLEWDRDLRPEFQRLVEGAAGQRLSRDTGGEAEIVLDSRRCARLAAHGAVVEDDDRRPLGC